MQNQSEISFVFAGTKTNVYEQELTTAKYLYQIGLPSLASLTICFWLKLINNGRNTKPAVVSIAAPGRWITPNTHSDEHTAVTISIASAE